jgi:ABC-type sugar transport system ATPase subunit
MVGRALGSLSASLAIDGRRLEVENLVPGSATFTLHRGEVLIAGLLGAGRTRCWTIFGLEPVTSGRIRLAAFRWRRRTNGGRAWGC